MTWAGKSHSSTPTTPSSSRSLLSRFHFTYSQVGISIIEIRCPFAWFFCHGPWSPRRVSNTSTLLDRFCPITIIISSSVLDSILPATHLTSTFAGRSCSFRGSDRSETFTCPILATRIWIIIGKLAPVKTYFAVRAHYSQPIGWRFELLGWWKTRRF